MNALQGVFPDLIVREAGEADMPARTNLVSLATDALRRIYCRKRASGVTPSVPSGILVAECEGRVVGTAEYLENDDFLYLQGVAVHPAYRRRGVCRRLVGEVKTVAVNRHYSSLQVRVIAETGNAPIFEKLGFAIIRREVATDYQGPKGEAVTLVTLSLSLN